MYRPTRVQDRLSLAALFKKSELSDQRGWARHLQAEEHLLFVLVGFAGSVVVTRSFLEWAGYP